MTSTFLFAFVLMVVLVTMMAVGVIWGREPIKGSCGGMKALGLEMECEICGGDLDKCDTASATSTLEEHRMRATRIGD